MSAKVKLARPKLIKFVGVCLLTFILAFGSLLAGCSTGSSEQAANTPAAKAVKDSLKIFVGEEPETGFDPTQGWGSSVSLFFTGLLSFDKKGNLQNELASEYKVSDDGLTYTYTLRKDIKFSDGTVLKPSDVVFTYLTTRDNGTSTIDLKMLKDAKVEGDTVVFTLNKPWSVFPSISAQLGIVPEATYQEATFMENPVGTGAFKLLEWSKGQQMIVEPNQNFYGQISPFKQITILFLDGDTALANAQSGQLDVVMVQPEYANNKVNGMTLETFKTIDNRGFNLPTAKESTNAEGVLIGNNVTSDYAIRYALNIGIDRQQIIDDALSGVGTPAYTRVDQMPWFNKETVFKDNRPEEAIAALEAAGWVLGADGVRVKDGIRASFEITGRTDDLQRYNLAEAFSQAAKPLGIEIKASAVAWSDCKKFADNIPTCWGTGDYNPYDLETAFYTTGMYNRSQYSNPAVDAYIDTALTTSSQAEAIQNWIDCQWDGTQGPSGEKGDTPFIWLANIDHCYFVAEGLDLGTQIPHPHGHGWPVVMNMNEWKISS